MSSKWVPLEASPDVYNSWSTPIGLPAELGFQDLYSLDPDFLQYTPQPVYAVLLLFPCRGKLQETREQEEAAGEGRWQGHPDANKPVWWIKQTIGNACGSIGLLHALLNLPTGTPHSLSSDCNLSKFYEQSLPMTGLERAKLLESTDFFTKAHTQSAEAGQSRVPRSQEELENVENHFIAFIQAQGADGANHVVELDGSTRNGPFDRGALEGTFLESVANVVQSAYINRAEGDLNFNMIVLGAKGEDED